MKVCEYLPPVINSYQISSRRTFDEVGDQHMRQHASWRPKCVECFEDFQGFAIEEGEILNIIQ